MSEPGAQVDPEVDELPSFGCGYCPRDTVNKPRPLSYRGVPEQILSRTIEYKSLPQADHEEWRDRHRDVPCVFRNSLSYLFTVGQQVELHQLFYPPDPPLPVRSSPRVGRELPAGPRRKGWKADTESKLLSLCGYLRQSSTHRHEYESYPDWNEKLRQAQAVGLNLDPASRTYKNTVLLGSALPNQLSSGRSYVLSDMSFTGNEVVFNASRHLRQGPPLFAANNLLEASSASDPTGLQLLVANRDSNTPVHQDYYGTDGYLTLMEGMKIWFMAPSRYGEAFGDMFAHTIPISTLSHTRTAEYRNNAVQAVVQNAGDTVFIPAGWWHCVKNLTDTVAFGGSYLRPWKLRLTLDFLRTDQTPSPPFNFQQVFDHFQQHGTEMGFSEGKVNEIYDQWLKVEKKKEGSDKVD